MPQTKDCGIQKFVGNEVLLVSKRDVWLKRECETILCARAHDQWMIALKDLQVVHVAVVSAVFWIFGDDVEIPSILLGSHLSPRWCGGLLRRG